MRKGKVQPEEPPKGLIEIHENARIAKLNELIRIEEMLGNKAKMAKL
jgi:enolase